MDSIKKKILENLNLSKSQAAVYIAALELGQATMQDLARKSGVKRTSIYNFIGDLVARGFLVEVKRKKRKFYSGVDPDQLLEIQKARMLELESFLPELRAIANNSSSKPKVTFYEGIENVLSVYYDQLKVKETIYAYEDPEYMKLGMTNAFYTNWPKERTKKEIAFKSITRDSEVTREYVKTNIKYLRQSKIIRTPEPWKTEINIYGSKVALFRFREDGSMCVLVEDENIASTMRFSWQLLWDNLDVPIIG